MLPHMMGSRYYISVCVLTIRTSQVMAFMLRAQLDCPSDEVSSTLLDALRIFAGLQEEHTSLVTYHFARPDPQKRPHHFECTEVYTNEAVFWSHSSSSEFVAAYKKAFNPANNIQSVTYGYGPGFGGKLKKVCDTISKHRYPQATAGFVLNPQEWDTARAGNSVLLVARIQAKEGKSDEILQLLSKLSEGANNGVVVCHGSVPEEKDPTSIELVEVCTTNDHLTVHLCGDKGKDLMKAISLLAEHVVCEGYGNVHPTTVQLFSVELGLKLVAKATDAGYVLHSHADPLGK